MDQKNINKEPWLALILSSFFSRVGQLYSGKIAFGIGIITIQVILFFTSIWLFIKGELAGFITLLFCAIIFIWNILHAFFSTRKHNSIDFETERKTSIDPWMSVFLTRIFPGLGHLYQKKYLTGIIIVILTVIIQALIGIKYPFVSIFIGVIIASIVSYIVYKSAPIKRENSLNPIIIVSILFFISYIAYFGFAMMIREYAIQAYYIPNGSMEDTLLIGDHIFVEKLTYNKYFTSRDCTNGNCIQRGDLVIFSPPGDSRIFIKRCIAIEGDQFNIKEGKVILNNEEITESYAKGTTTYDGFRDEKIEGKVPAGMIVVLGDNRENSSDSRYFGYVPAQSITARCALLYWNTHQIKKSDFSRFGKIN